MNIAVILAGGTGTRLGEDTPKQYIEVNEKPIIGYCIDKFIACDAVDAIQIVADVSWHEYVEDYIHKCEINNSSLNDGALNAKWKGFSESGENRQLSIYNALEDVLGYASTDDYVMIHDAARPMIRAEFIEKCFDAAKGHDGVLPVLAMKDTVYFSEDGGKITSLLEREKVFAGQAPEVFRFGKYYEANKALLPDKILKINGSTEPAVMAGMDIAMIAGAEENFKITTKDDLERFRHLLKVCD